MSLKGAKNNQVSALPLEKEDVSKHQEAVPLPYFAGTRKMALRWMTGATDRVTKKLDSGAKKGLGTGSSSYRYYGTFIGGLSYGPVDKLFGIYTDQFTGFVDEPPLFEDELDRGVNDYVDLTADIDPKYFRTTAAGLLFFYGTAAQDVTAALDTTHPEYHNIACVVARAFLFGNDRTTAPNMEVLAGRLPQCSTSLCAAIHNVFEDGQVNPVAVLAELCTSDHGLRLDVSRLDAASWADAAEWCYDRRTLRFCSPLITDVVDARRAFEPLLQLIGGALAWTASGTLALRLMEWGVDPGGLTTLDAQYLTAKPVLKTSGWSDVPTGVIVQYADRDREFKQADVKLDNLIARRVRGEHQLRTIDLSSLITRRAQAEALAAEYIRQMQHPPSSAEIIVRREHASYRCADKVMVDVDPEPGGSGLEHLAIIQDRRDDGKGDISFSVKLDPIADSTPYTPTFTPPAPQDADVDSIVNAHIIPLPGSLDGGNPLAVAVLAARPQDDATGFRVTFQTDNGSDFAELGRQEGFAVRMTLDAAVLTGGELTVGVTYVIEVNSGGADFTGVGAANNNVATSFVASGTTPTWGTGQLRSTTIEDDDAVLRLTLTDGASGRDAYLAERTAGDAITAATDFLLAIILTEDGNGAVDIDADGLPIMEICSVVSRTAVDSDTHNYTLLRGRAGLTTRAWTTAAKVWIIPGADLLPWFHEDMLGLLQSGDTGYIRLGAFTAYVEDETNPLPEFEFVMPEAYNVDPLITWVTPSTSTYDLDDDGKLGGHGGSPANDYPDADLTDADGNLVRVELFSTADSVSPVVKTVHLDVAIPPTAATTLQDCLELAGLGTSGSIEIDFGAQGVDDKYFTLTLRLTDSTGAVTEDTRTLILPGSAGAGLGGVNYNFPGDSYVTPFNLTLSVGGSATKIHYALLVIGSPSPSSYTTVNATSKVIYMNTSKRVWARASDGTNHSAWQYQDYVRESGL